jgi:membrane associated rhomboid family serine protease
MSQVQLQVPKLDKLHKGIIISLVSIYVLQSILLKTQGIVLSHHLGLAPASFWSGQIYTLLTYPFVGEGLTSLILNCLLFWFLGSELLELWGKKRYISFLLSSYIGGGLIFALIGLSYLDKDLAYFPLIGCAGISEALLVAFAILFPDRQFSFMFFFPIKAKYFCLIVIAMQIYMGLMSPSGVLSWGHLGSMFSGFIWMILITKFAQGKKQNNKTSIQRKISRANLKLVNKDESSSKSDNSPKYWQ